MAETFADTADLKTLYSSLKTKSYTNFSGYQ